jgi:hypothetical protein
MGRKPINGVAMTPAETTQRYRAKIAAERAALEKEVEAARRWRTAVMHLHLAQANGRKIQMQIGSRKVEEAIKAYDAAREQASELLGNRK